MTRLRFFLTKLDLLSPARRTELLLQSQSSHYDGKVEHLTALVRKQSHIRTVENMARRFRRSALPYTEEPCRGLRDVRLTA